MEGRRQGRPLLVSSRMSIRAAAVLADTNGGYKEQPVSLHSLARSFSNGAECSLVQIGPESPAKLHNRIRMTPLLKPQGSYFKRLVGDKPVSGLIFSGGRTNSSLSFPDWSFPFDFKLDLDLGGLFLCQPP